MTTSAQKDVLIVACTEHETVELSQILPMEDESPDVYAFFCFFRTLEDRGQFLNRLREIAGQRLQAGAHRDLLERELALEYVDSARAGRTEEAMYTMIRWRTQLQRQGYHSYNLTEGVPPYRTGCVIAFDELPSESIRRHLARALQHIRQGRERVLDAFGFGGLL